MPIIPTPGADALAAGMPLVPGTGLAADLEEYINQTRDIIAQRTSAVTPVAKGGTGATTAAQARANLDVPKTADLLTRVLNDAPQAIKLGWAGGRITIKIDSTYISELAYIGDVNSRVGKDGDTMTGSLTVNGHVYVPNSTPAINGYTVAYINSDGRISKGASSERYKKNITAIDPDSLGDIFPELHRFKMRQGDGAWKYGWIAERLAENPATQPFVVYNEQDAPDSIDFIALLAAQNAQLHQAVDLLTQRIETLEAQHADR